MASLKRAVLCLVLLICFSGALKAQTVSPYILNVGSKPYLLRSYMLFEGKKRTQVISVGNPEKVNYSYDLKTGALLQVWRGGFLDVTEMWKDRGEPQLAKPLGTVLAFTAAPFLAALADKETAWPDSIAFDDLQNKGYVLGRDKMPAFQYVVNGADVNDKIAVLSGSIERTIRLSNGKQMMYCRLAFGPAIEKQDNNVYAVVGKVYSVKVAGGSKAFIRKTKDGQELLVPMAKGTASLTYSIIW
ncbi:MAG: hypothetical protein V4594_25455 [Bacteroidota bacterium]